MYLPTLFLGVLAALPLARCIAFGGPVPTNVIQSVDKAGQGWTPRPTKGPLAGELRLRQAIVTLTTGFNSDTCGWVATDGILGDYYTPITCPGSRTCELYTSSNIGMAGCCNPGDTQNCAWAKSCVPYDAYTKKSCDSSCMTDPFIWRCSDSKTPYCVTWTYPSAGVADYACATYNSGVVTVLQTAEDESSYYWKTLSTLSGDAMTGWKETSSIEESTTESSDDFAGPTTVDDSGATNNPVPTPAGKKKSTPIGAIVGGVVGGLVVLFLIGAAVIFFCLKQRKKKQLANSQTIIAAQQSHQPPPPQSEFKPPMQQQYAPPAGVHSPPPQNGFYAAPGQDQKHGYQVHEQGLQSPVISNPSTPAPAYVQPHYAQNTPPMPSEGVVQYPAKGPTPGTHEVDAISSQPVSPVQQGVQSRPVQTSNVYEIGGGR